MIRFVIFFTSYCTFSSSRVTGLQLQVTNGV